VELVEDVFPLKIFKLFGLRNFPITQESTTETEQILMVVHIRGLFFFQPPMGYKKKDKLT